MAEMMTSGRMSRAPSVSSTGTASSSVNYSFVPRYIPKPEPAYISASSAAEFVTHRHRHESYDLLSPAASPTNDGAVFTPSSLNLLNAFLDSLLYNFIAKARGTSLNQLRPAILEVLKARLGRDALATADEELHGLVDDHESDCDDTNDFPHRPSSVAPDWHLESAFKRMRLRVMVFIRLGDFEDEDEDRFLEEDENCSSHSHEFGLQSSPAPVYLATVLEYLAELALSLAGDAAYARSKSRARRTIAEDGPLDTSQVENVIVEDRDVEKIALNSALGRLWRTWLKSYKSTLPAGPASPGRSRYDRRDSFASPTRSVNDVRTSFRKDSGASMTIEEESQEASRTHSRAQREVHGAHDEIPECEPSETEIAANIPLPINERDVDEIEVPGLANVVYDDDEERDEEFLEPQVRRRSSSFVLSPVESQPAPESRLRSSSVPSATRVPWDWIPLSVRRALKRQAELDREVELAASIPLPEDSTEVEVASGSADGEELDVEDAPVATADMGAPSGTVAGAATAAAVMGSAAQSSTGPVEADQVVDERASSPDPSEQFYDIPDEDDAEAHPAEQELPATEGRRSTESDDTVVPTAGEVEEHQKDLASSKEVSSPRDSTLTEATDATVDGGDDAQRAVSPPLDQHPAMIAQRVHSVVNATRDPRLPAVTQQNRNGPPRPLPATAANPYAMLYDDDVEPELIGVARTSNVPIHSTTPSISAEQRPWTPNRGVPSVMRNGAATPDKIQERTSLGDRTKAAPSPLRSIGRENVSDATAVREVPRSMSQDTERPVNPERYTKYVTVKESPTIPRFYTSGSGPLHTPTEARPPSGTQSSHSGRDTRHSPKGSQGSTGTRDRGNKTEEEARFDALLATKEPVKYTLTPEEIRDPAVSPVLIIHYAFYLLLLSCHSAANDAHSLGM